MLTLVEISLLFITRQVGIVPELRKHEISLAIVANDINRTPDIFVTTCEIKNLKWKIVKKNF